MRSFLIRVVATTLLAGSLAACGKSAPKGPLAAVGLFTSASDCASTNKATLDECKKAIDGALAAHEKSSKVYISERLCDEQVGPGRCEKFGESKFRPRLAAFLVTFSKPVTGEPLYAPKKTDVVGYVTANNAKTYLTIDETLIVTPAAKQIAYSFASTKGRR